ncbi:FAD-dependent oxidoreductase [Limobrevibacterium gyesilva]|uniref:FAD-dependent oxidoreductase n=1 Tax=Limobrevibacterium gyesilva TaxID=2991712 RepID=A0AA42CGT6_9PROT|nr:FAD-dependent oxidoreductase [Limobrevibacterium gyesilva]MCW3474170.1 FAD-dependent oxidoreductase [Limobrevibacterium gyesilva]
METSVLVVGGGPVGLTAAMDLAWRGIDVTVVELHHRGAPPNVKCNHVSARSMEIFRRLGVARAVRDTGLPPDYANDISYRTTTLGTELTRIPIPCRAERYTATGGPDTWWPTPEPPHRINQIFLEPVLFAHAASMPGVRILNRCSVDGFTQDADSVTATVRNLDNGATFAIHARYLLGCDGGRSAVRKAIGATLKGDAVVQRVQSTYIRAPKLIGLIPDRPAWVMFSLNPRRSGNVMAIDGHERWLIHNYLRDDEPDFESVDRDWAIRTIIGAPPDFEYDVITKEDWYGRRLVADRFRDRRAFIAGDAAHLWVPYAGYGMNAGIADAANLTWQLAAVLQGWADTAILDAYEAERQPITEQVSVFAMNHAAAMARTRREVPANIEAPGPEGDAVRAQVGKAAYDLNVTQYCCGGLNFGYFYAGSPIIAADGEAPPPYSMYDFTPSTVPGCRTPHVWLRDGRSLYDAMGPGYTLLRFDSGLDVAPLLTAAARRGVPLALLDVDSEEAAAVYRQKLVLSRPDQHVAWRGDGLPDDPGGLIELIRGADHAARRLAA